MFLCANIFRGWQPLRKQQYSTNELQFLRSNLHNFSQSEAREAELPRVLYSESSLCITGTAEGAEVSRARRGQENHGIQNNSSNKTFNCLLLMFSEVFS